MQQNEDLYKKIKKQNKNYLKVFELDLKADNLKPKTINTYLNDVDFYINVYLLRNNLLHMAAGCEKINDFLEDFFIQKIMWLAPSSIKSNIMSIRKFYKSMLDHGYIDSESYTNVCNDLKEFMPEWLSKWEVYNDLGW